MLPYRRSIVHLRPPRICEKLRHKGWPVIGVMARSFDVREAQRQPRTAPVRDASRLRRTASTARLFVLEGLPTNRTWQSRAGDAAATLYQAHTTLSQVVPSESWRRDIQRACHSSSTSMFKKRKLRLSKRATVSTSRPHRVNSL